MVVHLTKTTFGHLSALGTQADLPQPHIDPEPPGFRHPTAHSIIQPSCQRSKITCYGPNCCRIFGRIVTIGISAHFRRVGRIVENPGELFEPKGRNRSFALIPLFLLGRQWL